MKCRHQSSQTTTWVIVIAAIVAVATTLTVLAIKFRWVDKLLTRMRKGYQRPSFTCDFEDLDSHVTDISEDAVTE